MFRIDVRLSDSDGEFFTTVSSNWHKYECAESYKKQLEGMNPSLQFCIFEEDSNKVKPVFTGEN